MKIKKFLFPTLIVLFIVSIGFSNIFQTDDDPLKFPSGSKYKKEWAKVDSLENLGLPKSALEIVNSIYEDASKNNNSDQIIKSTMYRMKYMNMVEENAFEAALKSLEEDVKKAKFPNSSLMHSILAEMYWMYYQNNRWTFYSRTQTVSFDPVDIKTWDLNRLADKSIKHYQLSLMNADSLKRTSVSVYDEVITDYKETEKYRPTLYDFLAHRAIRFYQNTELALTRPAEKFMLRENFYFAEAQEFANTSVNTKDTMALQFYGIKTLQELLKFRISNSNRAALLYADLDRIEFVYSNSVSEIKDSLYLLALQKMEKKFADIPESSEISYLIANYYYQQSSKYNPLDESTERFKFLRKKAHEICTSTIDKYPEAIGALKCKYLKSSIEAHNLTVSVEEVVVPGSTFSSLISYQNISKVYIRVSKIDNEKLKRLEEKYYNNELIDKLLKESIVVHQYTQDLPDDKDFHSHTAEFLSDSLSFGTYLFFISNNPDFTYKESMIAYTDFVVSGLSYLNRSLTNGSQDIYVTSRNTGKALPGVTVNKWISKYDYVTRTYKMEKTGVYISDEKGYFNIPYDSRDRYNSYYLEFVKGSDRLFSSNYFYSYYYDNAKDIYYSTTLFTDRAIYRPGQTVHFKGITLKIDGDKKDVATAYPVNVIFYDVNYQKVSELQLTTNEFGTFSGTFDIPTGLLNGQMQIYTASGSKYVSVEEYKRPKFEVSMLPFDGNYRLNDTVEIKGQAKTYAGSSLSDADVTYRVVRRPYWRGWWSWYWGYNTSETEIANGKVITDETGVYKIKFKAVPDISMPANNFLDFVYSVYADVTDLNGETQSTQSSVTIGYTALTLGIDIPEMLNKEDTTKFHVQTTNLNGQFVKASGQMKIFRLEEYPHVLDARKWSQPDKYLYSQDEWYKKFPGNIYKKENEIQNLKKEKEILSHSFDTEKSTEFIFKEIKSLPVGRYKIEMESKDAFGKEITYESYFTLFSEKEKTLPYKTADWFSVVKAKGEPGEFAGFIIGSSKNDVSVLYEVEHKGKIIHKEWLTLNNEQRLIECGITEDYRGNFSVHFTFIKNNRFYSHNENIYVPYTNKDLDIEFATFRNKLLPGESEEWKIIIKGPKGEKVAAEMVASLYDASLDKFRQNYWSFSPYSTYYTSMSLSGGMFSYLNSSLYKENVDNYYSYPSEYYEYLNWFGFNYYGYYAPYTATGGSGKRNGRSKNGNGYALASKVACAESSADEAEEKKFDGLADDFNGKDRAIAGDKAKESESQQNQPGQAGQSGEMDDVKLRSNFNETAFFYPHLQTDQEGNIIVKFTVPESLTRWKMMGFAHTKDLMYGQIFNELVTQKELMLMPNSPRFFRENDEIEFPVKISSLSENELKGQVKLELFDALTMEPVEGIFTNGENQTKDFSVKAQGNSLVSWRLKIPEGVQAIDYKVVAKAGKFSDGEEKVIPVLTNRMLVTETMPLPVRGNQTKTFNFEKLLNSGDSKTLKHEKYTLEFTSNPAWYAVQALPYLMEYPYECAEQIFSRYYANSLASHIANSSPKIKAVFDSWKNTPDSKALLSNLEKNQELKSVLLEETPWVLNAQSETERKKRVGLLFDLNKMGNELETAIKKLMKMQSSNGGWPWFTGMPESRYITQHIITGMGHLDNLKVTSVRENKDVWNMVVKGIDYLDARMKDDYDYLKKHYTPEEMKTKHIDYTQIQYLYARSYFRDLKIPARCNEAFDYYKGQAEKYWLSESKYMQGMIALALYRYENLKVPADIVKSLRENSITDEEMGMYWKEPNGYYWYQAPIERQALLIEVFDEVAKDQKAVDDLKVWLLKQKQTQDWRTTKATVEAVYALLLRGTDWLQSDQLVEIKIGDMIIDPKKMDDVKIEAGTGYFKTSWNKGEIKPEMGKVTVTKKDEGVSWGAVYWQYFEQLDKITPAETPLKLQKKLFIERDTESGKVIEPVSNNAKLKVGDKVIVRIELRVDRAMEYVHMKDMRASGFEPINVISTYKYQGGLGYYESTKDAATNFFISYMPKGTYVFEYPLRVQHKGDFSNGITSIQCMYAPEFASHSEGIRVKVE